MKKEISISMIGGDSRQIYAAQKFASLGYKTKIFACELENITDKKLHCKNIEEALQNNVLILPLPLTKNSKTLNTPLSDENIEIKSLINYINERHVVFLGMGSASHIRQLQSKTQRVYDYYSDESFILKNALLTAEGLISILTEKLPVTIHGLKVGITGYGRIASFTSAILKKLNADVSVFARNKNQLTKACLDGIKAYNLADIKKHISTLDCLINTIPHQIIDENIIKKSDDNCVFVETASLPYGINAADCLKHNRTLIKAFSLPGRNSPKTAGIIIAETVEEIIKEELI